ncbi:DUF4406 domain-containing protein [Ornithobacterium rhinotracheale]
MFQKVYIAGKVTGLDPVAVFQKFEKAEIAAQNKFKKAEIINPVKLVGDPLMDWNTAMDICLKTLVTCDLIYVLPCWVDSKGAMLEIKTAKKIGMGIFYV